MLKINFYFLLLTFPFCLCTGCQDIDTASYRHKSNQQKALLCCETARHIIQTGDILTRTGNDLTSATLRKLNRNDQTYSHVGIASIENGIVYIYHAVGGESNPDEKLKRDRLSQYVNGYDNQGFGIFRFGWNAATKEAVREQAQNLYKKAIVFDMAFDLATDDKLYCTEFVAKTIEKIVHKTNYFKKDTLSGKRYIAPDAIFLHPECREIKRLRYF
ncbi:MAG: YiiX/YebB-like N1pC/P60 family cysteine hydrolase [Chitinophagaceae bacterium]